MSLCDARALSVLTIAGSDSGGGASIQADLKTFAAHGLHGLSAFAALTAQNTRGVTAVHVPPVAFLREQIDACFDDFRIGAVKLGMLANKDVIDAVADALEHHRPAFIVLDPVMVATAARACSSRMRSMRRVHACFRSRRSSPPIYRRPSCCSGGVSRTMQMPRPHWRHFGRWARKPCCSIRCAILIGARDKHFCACVSQRGVLSARYWPSTIRNRFRPRKRYTEKSR